MTRLEWTLGVVVSAISIASILLAIFQYLNRRGGQKIRVVRKSLLLTLFIALPIWIIGLFFFISSKHVTVSVGDSPLNSDTNLLLVYGLESTDYPSSVGIPMWIKNDGDQSIENLTITLTYNSDYIMPWLEDQTKQVGLGPIEQMDRETHSYEGITSSTIHVKSIGPGQKFFAADPFLWTTEYLSQIKLLSYPTTTISIRISAQDIAPWNCAITVSAVPGRSFDEAFSNHLKLSDFKSHGEIIVAISPFSFVEKENLRFYSADVLRIETTKYSIEDK